MGVPVKAVPATDKATLKGFVQEHAHRQSRVYTDEARAYETLPLGHESVKHSVSEYVRGQAHTNGVRSFCSRRPGGAALLCPPCPSVSAQPGPLGQPVAMATEGQTWSLIEPVGRPPSVTDEGSAGRREAGCGRASE